MIAGRAAREQFLKFLVAGGLSVPVNLGSRHLLSLTMPYEAAVVVSHLCGMLTAFLLTRSFVFGRSNRRVSNELARFTVVNLVSLSVTWVVAVGLLRIVFPRVGFDIYPELVAHIAGLGVSSFTSFYGHRHYSFGKL
jgi:putative flippase GtrA